MGLIKLYVQLITEQQTYTDPLAHHIIHPELLNIHSILLTALFGNTIDQDVYPAAIHYSEWRMYLGFTTEDIIRLAEKKSADAQDPYNCWCLRVLVQVHMAKYKWAEAETSLLQAVDLHNEGSDWKMLAELRLSTPAPTLKKKIPFLENIH